MAPMCSILPARLVIGRMSSINIMWTVTSSTRLGGCLQQLLQLTHFHKFPMYPLPRGERVLNSGTVTSTYVHFPRRSVHPVPGSNYCDGGQLLLLNLLWHVETRGNLWMSNIICAELGEGASNSAVRLSRQWRTSVMGVSEQGRRQF
jgi:hypothetical protein